MRLIKLIEKKTRRRRRRQIKLPGENFVKEHRSRDHHPSSVSRRQHLLPISKLSPENQSSDYTKRAINPRIEFRFPLSLWRPSSSFVCFLLLLLLLQLFLSFYYYYFFIFFLFSNQSESYRLECLTRVNFVAVDQRAGQRVNKI